MSPPGRAGRGPSAALADVAPTPLGLRLLRTVYTLITVHPSAMSRRWTPPGCCPPSPGIAVHDGWAPYDTYTAATHARCDEILVDYLRRRQDGPGAADTGALIDHLLQQPDTPLSRALDSPLNLTLLRADPTANAPLLVPGRFTSRSQIEDFLLARVVPSAYAADRPPGLTGQEARQWDDHITAQRQGLEFIAARMDGTDLAWWRISHWAPAWQRCLANGLAGVLVMSNLGMLVFGPIGEYTVRGSTGIRFGWQYGAFMGGCFGLLAGMISEARDPNPAIRDMFDRIRGIGSKIGSRCLPNPQRLRPSRLASAAGAPVPFNHAIALLIVAIMTMAVGNQSGLPLPLGHLLFGLPPGIVAAAIAGRAASHPRLTPIDRTRRLTWRPGRADLLTALSIGTPIGLTYALTKTPQFGVLAAKPCR